MFSSKSSSLRIRGPMAFTSSLSASAKISLSAESIASLSFFSWRAEKKKKNGAEWGQCLYRESNFQYNLRQTPSQSCKICWPSPPGISPSHQWAWDPWRAHWSPPSYDAGPLLWSPQPSLHHHPHPVMRSHSTPVFLISYAGKWFFRRWSQSSTYHSIRGIYVIMVSSLSATWAILFVLLSVLLFLFRRSTVILCTNRTGGS